ncbi:exosortase A [Methyloversatilis thermotolerans]|uniref:exosortase A n=1 Tax=Methyloversatilis thermotolerans TaxID=1346290 RepID=UPI0003776318|nr:exosortase A [Methyloversatilis thermotolerans]
MPVADAVRTSAGWRSAGPVFLLLCALLFVLYRDTALSMAEIWWRSETFAHGLIVPPVFLWLVWRRRAALAALDPRPSALGLLALVLAFAGWLVADLAGVQVVRQLAFVASIPALVIAVLGWRIAWDIAYPLAFLFLGVPMGEGLMLPLMNTTADFTVFALQAMGFPVYREGTFFELPSGSWSVVEACSGLRYLIASFTVGALYAYLSYRSPWRRAAFIVAAVATPVLANWLRALMIVLLAHYSDMKIATGVDHIIYGWVFFGAVMLLLFWIGSFWQESDAVEVPAASPAVQRSTARARLWMTAAIAAVLLLAPLALNALFDGRPLPPAPAFRLPAVLDGGWVRDDGAELTDWRPTFQNPDRVHVVQYRRNDEVVMLELAWYGKQRQDAELINSRNFMIRQEHEVWSNVGERITDTPLHPVRETQLRSPALRLLIHDWFVVGDRPTTSSVRAKLLFARDILLGRGDDGHAVVMWTPQDAEGKAARARLEDFSAALAPALTGALAP